MPIDSPTLLRQLMTLGLTAGATVMVHASMRRAGPINGGAEALLDSIQSVIGPTGNLLMVLGADDSMPFDPLTSPVEKDIGVLAEVFRKRTGTRVNDHPAARFGANGPKAEELLRSNPLHDYYSHGSVLDRFTKHGGVILRLGANIDTVTVTHWAEYLANIPNKRRARRRYERADIGELWIDSLDDTDGIVDWSDGDYFSQILLDYLNLGRATIGQVGNCTAELFSADDYVRFAVSWMESNLKGR